MKIKTLIITAMLALSMVVGATGCAVSTETSTSSISQSAQENSSIYSEDNDTKVQQMLDKVTLNGEPLKIPYTQSDLPEGFTFEEDVSIYEKNGNKYVYCDLLFNGKKISNMRLKNYKENSVPEEFVSYSIGYSYLNEDVADIVKIDDICGKNKKKDVLDKFGEPKKRETTDNGTEVLYYDMDSTDSTYIQFWFTKDDIISTIFIVNNI